MNRPFWIVIFLFSIVCTSCQKEHLYDEREVFIGTWQWDYSQHIHTCQPVSVDTVFSSDFGTSFSIEVTRREKFFTMRNDEVVNKTPILVSSFGPSTALENGYSFAIYFDEENPELVDGHISQDTLRLHEFWPPDLVDDLCNEYSHFFIRTN